MEIVIHDTNWYLTKARQLSSVSFDINENIPLVNQSMSHKLRKCQMRLLEFYSQPFKTPIGFLESIMNNEVRDELKTLKFIKRGNHEQNRQTK